jgi:hypothetical protein
VRACLENALEKMNSEDVVGAEHLLRRAEHWAVGREWGGGGGGVCDCLLWCEGTRAFIRRCGHLASGTRA